MVWTDEPSESTVAVRRGGDGVDHVTGRLLEMLGTSRTLVATAASRCWSAHARSSPMAVTMG